MGERAGGGFVRSYPNLGRDARPPAQVLLAHFSQIRCNFRAPVPAPRAARWHRLVVLPRVMGIGGRIGSLNGKPHRSGAGKLKELIADHPALSNEIAHTVGPLAAACTIKLPRAGAAEIVFAPAYATGVAILVDAASVGDGNEQTILSSIVAKRHGLGGTCRQRHGGSNQNSSEQFSHYFTFLVGRAPPDIIGMACRSQFQWRAAMRGHCLILPNVRHAGRDAMRAKNLRIGHCHKYSLFQLLVLIRVSTLQDLISHCIKAASKGNLNLNTRIQSIQGNAQGIPTGNEIVKMNVLTRHCV